MAFSPIDASLSFFLTIHLLSPCSFPPWPPDQASLFSLTLSRFYHAHEFLQVIKEKICRGARAKHKALAQPGVLHGAVLLLSPPEGYMVTITDSKNNSFRGWQPDDQRNGESQLGKGSSALERDRTRGLGFTRRAVSTSPGARTRGIRGNLQVQNKQNQLFLYPACLCATGLPTRGSVAAKSL